MENQTAIIERAGIITMKGNPLTLIGQPLKVGDKAPDFEVLDSDLSVVKSSTFLGRRCIISAVPSLDTPVCSLETCKFNNQIAELPSDVVMLTISTDLPFAQKRWCQAESVENIQVLSDHKNCSFGYAFGVLIKELRLLARAVFVVNKKGIIDYIEIVGELTNEPNYRLAIDAACNPE